MNFKIKQLVRGAIIAAIYATLCLVMPQPLTFGPIQLRIAETLTLLPFLFPEAVWGVTLGCLISNIFGSGFVIDIVFGTLATFLAAIATRKTKSIWLAPLPPILFNAVIVGVVVALNTYKDISFAVILTTCLSIGISQGIVCYIIGIPFMALMNKLNFLFK